MVQRSEVTGRPVADNVARILKSFTARLLVGPHMAEEKLGFRVCVRTGLCQSSPEGADLKVRAVQISEKASCRSSYLADYIRRAWPTSNQVPYFGPSENEALTAGPSTTLPGFPVELGGFGELHAPFFTERRTRGSLQRSVVEGPAVNAICAHESGVNPDSSLASKT